MKVAIIGPKFFGYCESVANEISRRENYDAVYFDELPSNNIVTKILVRLRLGILLGDRISVHHERINSILTLEKFDMLLSLNSETLSLDWLHKLEVKCKLFYMWDSVQNKPAFTGLMHGFDRVATFDPKDSEKLNIPLIHLFAEKEFLVNGRARDIELCFVGTIHSTRLRIIKRIEKHYSVKGHLYYHSKLLFLISEFLNFGLAMFYLRRISTNKLSKGNVADLFSRSKAVIDIAHPGQNGLTSRTFEALTSGCFLYTNNIQNVRNYLPDSLQFRVRDVADLYQYGKNDIIAEPISEDEEYWLSINRFVDEILSLIKLK